MGNFILVPVIRCLLLPPYIPREMQSEPASPKEDSMQARSRPGRPQDPTFRINGCAPSTQMEIRAVGLVIDYDDISDDDALDAIT